MSTIAGLVHDGRVYMASDSLGTKNDTVSMVLTTHKMFKKDQFLMGCVGDLRVRQIMQYLFTPPKIEDGIEIEHYMAACFIQELRLCLKENGYAQVENNVEEGINFLIGVRGRLFDVSYDYSLNEPDCGYSAVGSGWIHALDTLFVSDEKDPVQRLKEAIETAIHFDPYTGGPIHVDFV